MPTMKDVPVRRFGDTAVFTLLVPIELQVSEEIWASKLSHTMRVAIVKDNKVQRVLSAYTGVPVRAQAQAVFNWNKSLNAGNLYRIHLK